MANVELDKEFLELFFSVTNAEVPENVDLSSLKSQLNNIVDVIKKDLNTSPKKPYASMALENEEEEETENTNPAMLVVDDLGVITYQLKVLLSQFKYDIDCSQEIYDAVNKFKKRKYCYVVMDLFIPTEREGFILLTELRKLATTLGHKCIIGVITASPRKEIEQQCRARGADFFLEKNNDWQKSLYDVINGYISAEKTEEEDF